MELKSTDIKTVKSDLWAGTVVVHFVKKSGEDRLMLCTTSPEIIPDQGDASGRSRESNDEVQPVWDVLAAGWRSFRWDTVKGIYTHV